MSRPHTRARTSIEQRAPTATSLPDPCALQRARALTVESSEAVANFRSVQENDAARTESECAHGLRASELPWARLVMHCIQRIHRKQQRKHS